MNLITLDFETYFTDDYTLSKMTTESYIRDPRFSTHCVGIRHNSAPAEVWEGAPIQDEVAMQEGAVVCHHAHFDGLILSHHYDIKPAFWFDTLSMARLVFPQAKSHSLGALVKMLGLPEKNVPYGSFKNIRELPPELYDKVAAGCANDVELTYAVFQQLLPLVPRSELRLIDITIRMFTEPALGLNRAVLHDYLKTSKEQKDALLEQLGVTKETLGSAQKFASALQALGVEPPTKISPRTGEVAFAFAKSDQGLKDLLEHEDDRVALLTEARLENKSNILETRGQRMLDMDARGAMCVYLKYYGAHTGRWSGGDKMNWQNFKRGSALREAILAPEGYVLVVIDLAQIECRVLNWLAGQHDVLELFAGGQDVYCAQATKALGRTITKADRAERHLFKTAELGLGYGMGAKKFASVLQMQGIEADAEAMVATYRGNHRQVVALWKEADTALEHLLTATPQYSSGYVLGDTKSPVVRAYNKKIFYPGGSWSDYTPLQHDGQEYFMDTRRGRTKMYGAKLVENVVQALSRNILAEAMTKIAAKYKLATTTHDEVVYLAPESEAQAALAFGLNVMKTPPAWCKGLPLDAEGGYARNYSK